jgi:peptide-methionine (S)-S-oxide reductase
MNYILSLFIFIIATSCNSRNDSLHADISGVNAMAMQDLEQATFAGGCFWCTEAVFERVRGVENVISGYTGGAQENPTYKEVSYGKTDHAEAIQMFFYPNKISYQELVEIFFFTHDPTTLNKQGPDIGKQYRSAVYYHDEDQKQTAQKYIKLLTNNGTYNDPIVTELEPIVVFYPAENYHQDYYQKHPDHPYIQAIAEPKVIKFKKQFKEKLKANS